ncbi:4915_t:CDS:2, partial [Dentiscutata heterogama]
MANRLSVIPQLYQDILEFIKLILDWLIPFIANFHSISSSINMTELCLLIRADHSLDQCGQLFQQYVVDNYIKIERARLNYLFFTQNKICKEVYQGLQNSFRSGLNNIMEIECYIPEIVSELIAMQTSQDRPDLT